MAKFNIEVELDWLHDEDLDEAIRDEVVQGLQQKLIHNVERKMNEEMAEKIEKESSRVAEEFIENIATDRLGSIQMPLKTGGWMSEVEYVSLTEYIGKKFESMMKEKTLTQRGGKPDYRNDAVYSVIDYLTKGYIADELNDKIIDMIQNAKTQAEESLIKNLEENLQQQLNADMIQKLNIPALLEQLQNTIHVEGDKK